MKKLPFLLCLFTVLCLYPTIAYGGGCEIPILMYHDITPQEVSENPWAVTQQGFYEDMVYLMQNHYTPLLPQDLIAIKKGLSPMPQKPIMITFDDGYQSNYQYALPVMEALNMNATVSVITSLIRFSEEEGNGEYLTWAEVESMYKSGHFDIGSHTHNLHNSKLAGGYNTSGANGIERLEGENQTAYTERVEKDLCTSLEFIKTYTQTNPCYFAYPYGSLDPWITDILKKNGIQVTTTVKYSTADIQNGLFQLPRLTVTPTEPASFALTKKIQKASLPAFAIQKEVTIHQQNITMPAFLIADYAYISMADLQNQCKDTPYAFQIETDEKQGLRVLLNNQEPAPNLLLPTNLNTIEYCNRTIESAPILVSVGTRYAIAFPIEGQYFIRLKDAKQMILNEKTS